VLTLDRVVRPGATRQDIELPFAGLRRHGFGLTPGKLSMVAAGPGAGKSAFGMAVALDLGVPTLYASPDQDSWTTAIRVLAHNTGHPQSYIKACLEPGTRRPDELDVALLDAEHIQFTFDAYTTQEIAIDVEAYGVIHGAYPEFMVVDNLRNIARGDDGDYAAQGRALDELDALAQRTRRSRDGAAPHHRLLRRRQPPDPALRPGEQGVEVPGANPHDVPRGRDQPHPLARQEPHRPAGPVREVAGPAPLRRGADDLHGPGVAVAIENYHWIKLPEAIVDLILTLDPEDVATDENDAVDQYRKWAETIRTAVADGLHEE
jgi:hypothetical protein